MWLITVTSVKLVSSFMSPGIIMATYLVPTISEIRLDINIRKHYEYSVTYTLFKCECMYL